VLTVPGRDQVVRPLLALVAAGNGEHTVTISVTPDALGPVTVRAHISDGQVRLELFAPNDPGRESLRQLLPDLRRDLASTDLSATLDLSSQNGPPTEEDRQGRPAVSSRSTNEEPPARRQSEVGERVGSRIIDARLALDVLA
jgi:flagellar hook-length control protein FliK